MNNKALLLAALITFAAPHSASALSLSNTWLSGLSLSLGQDPVTQDETVTVVTKLNSNFGLMPVTIPLANPLKPAQVIGSVALVTDITGVNYSLQVSIDVTAAAKLKAPGLGLLPNNTLIPVGGVNPMNWIVLPLQSGLGQVYLNLDSTNKVAVIGTSIKVSAFATGVPLNMLMPFNLSKIGGLAGVYTGAKGQGGFALFFDGSSLFKK